MKRKKTSGGGTSGVWVWGGDFFLHEKEMHMVILDFEGLVIDEKG